MGIVVATKTRKPPHKLKDDARSQHLPCASTLLTPRRIFHTCPRKVHLLTDVLVSLPVSSGNPCATTSLRRASRLDAARRETQTLEEKRRGQQATEGARRALAQGTNGGLRTKPTACSPTQELRVAITQASLACHWDPPGWRRRTEGRTLSNAHTPRPPARRGHCHSLFTSPVGERKLIWEQSVNASQCFGFVFFVLFWSVQAKHGRVES